MAKSTDELQPSHLYKSTNRASCSDAKMSQASPKDATSPASQAPIPTIESASQAHKQDAESSKGKGTRVRFAKMASSGKQEGRGQRRSSTKIPRDKVLEPSTYLAPKPSFVVDRFEGMDSAELKRNLRTAQRELSKVNGFHSASEAELDATKAKLKEQSTELNKAKAQIKAVERQIICREADVQFKDEYVQACVGSVRGLSRVLTESREECETFHKAVMDTIERQERQDQGRAGDSQDGTEVTEGEERPAVTTSWKAVRTMAGELEQTFLFMKDARKLCFPDGWQKFMKRGNKNATLQSTRPPDDRDLPINGV